MEPTTITLYTRFQIGQVDPRIFYKGAYDPGSAHADEDGFRTDIVAARRRLDMTAVRYPGGNFVSDYRFGGICVLTCF